MYIVKLSVEVLFCGETTQIGLMPPYYLCF